MSRAHDAALAFLTAQHVQEQAQAFLSETKVTVKVTMAPAPSKAIKPRANEAAPIHPKREPMVGMMLPDRGSLDAKAFIIAMRNAGRRVNDAGMPYTNQGEVRNDQIRAIHGFMFQETKAGRVYVGYDPNRDFGSQEQEARALANRELRGTPKVSHITAPSRTLGGYVAGMPDMNARRLADLQGREVTTVESMLAHQRDADDMSRSVADRELSSGLADIERERLTQIRADIQALL